MRKKNLSVGIGPDNVNIYVYILLRGPFCEYGYKLFTIIDFDVFIRRSAHELSDQDRCSSTPTVT